MDTLGSLGLIDAYAAYDNKYSQMAAAQSNYSAWLQQNVQAAKKTNDDEILLILEETE